MRQRSSVLPTGRAWRERRRDTGRDIAEIYNRAGDGSAAYADGNPDRLFAFDDGLSFRVRYAAPGSRQAVCEKCCATKSAALNFCVVLCNLGGKPAELLQLVRGQPDAVLDGQDLEAAIDRQRTRLETEAIPPWR